MPRRVREYPCDFRSPQSKPKPGRPLRPAHFASTALRSSTATRPGCPKAPPPAAAFDRNTPRDSRFASPGRRRRPNINSPSPNAGRCYPSRTPPTPTVRKSSSPASAYHRRRRHRRTGKNQRRAACHAAHGTVTRGLREPRQPFVGHPLPRPFRTRPGGNHPLNRRKQLARLLHDDHRRHRPAAETRRQLARIRRMFGRQTDDRLHPHHLRQAEPKVNKAALQSRDREPHRRPQTAALLRLARDKDVPVRRHHRSHRPRRETHRHRRLDRLHRRLDRLHRRLVRHLTPPAAPRSPSRSRAAPTPARTRPTRPPPPSVRRHPIWAPPPVR